MPVARPWISLEVRKTETGFGLFDGDVLVHEDSRLSWVIGYADRNGLSWHKATELARAEVIT
jgi:hypothetical protein